MKNENCVCPICGKGFHLKPSAIKKAKNNYCSRECHREAKKKYMSGEYNHQYGLKGKLNASWKSDIKISNYGYIMVRDYNHPFCDKHGWVFEHRKVAEEHLLTQENSVEINGSLYLKSDYDVHHKNFDRIDNRVENLVVMHRNEHRALHCKLNPTTRNELGQFASDEPTVIKIKKVSETAVVPERQSIGAAGFDLYADIDKPIEIAPHETVLIQSGIAFEIPKNYFGAIYARSGISTRRGLRPATCVSVIDSDYRGSVGLPIHNDGECVGVIEPHERVAQIVFQKALIVDLELVDSLEDTDRGDNGFGSSGR
jgi:dUTP pyrophosphatase